MWIKVRKALPSKLPHARTRYRVAEAFPSADTSAVIAVGKKNVRRNRERFGVQHRLVQTPGINQIGPPGFLPAGGRRPPPPGQTPNPDICAHSGSPPAAGTVHLAQKRAFMPCPPYVLSFTFTY